MDLIDFNKVKTAEDFLDVLPQNENRLFEWKGAGILADNNRFDKEIGKQVSAFSNSGGGYLILGIDDKRNLDPVSTVRKKPSRKDWLAGKVRESVDYPLKDFSIHELPLTKQADNAVYVIQIEDSPAAPHMAISESRYYYRIEGRTEIAPHFYLDLLRSRTTKSKLGLTITRREFVAQGNIQLGTLKPLLNLELLVENLSLQCASPWGVVARSTIPEASDYFCKASSLQDGVFIDRPSALMPLTSVRFEVKIESRRNKRGYEYTFPGLWTPFSIELIAVSQNDAGNPVRLEWSLGTADSDAIEAAINRSCSRLGKAAAF